MTSWPAGPRRAGIAATLAAALAALPACGGVPERHRDGSRAPAATSSTHAAQVNEFVDVLNTGQGLPTPTLLELDQCTAAGEAADRVLTDVIGTATPTMAEGVEGNESVVAEASAARAEAYLCLGRPDAALPYLELAQQLRSDLTSETAGVVGALDAGSLPASGQEWRSFLTDGGFVDSPSPSPTSPTPTPSESTASPQPTPTST